MGDKEEIKIEIIDSELKIIEIPARGVDCIHSHVFDLEQFVTHSSELESDTCFFCARKCLSFKIDRKIAA